MHRTTCSFSYLICHTREVAEVYFSTKLSRFHSLDDTIYKTSKNKIRKLKSDTKFNYSRCNLSKTRSWLNTSLYVELCVSCPKHETKTFVKATFVTAYQVHRPALMFPLPICLFEMLKKIDRDFNNTVDHRKQILRRIVCELCFIR